MTAETPEQCADMCQVRAQIDRLDRELVALLAVRSRYIDRAAEIKKQAGLPADIGWRVEEVAMNARRNAEADGFDADLAERLWRQLIAWSIDRENEVLESAD
ncbi:chorismate mutase [Nitratireductor sp. XY-223]|uniref:chorismate mutase n=1 Tax=Nitratireductor sp. XY-223 TaxID=2561926 RepID=UPI0010AAB63D|nr:chorismate mutase [Nitratireductor sp. XY-223]